MAGVSEATRLLRRPLLAMAMFAATAAGEGAIAFDAGTEAAAARPMLSIVVPRQSGPARARLDKNVEELLAVLDQAGSPLPAEEREALAATAGLPDDLAIGEIQEILDRHAIASVTLNDEAWFAVQAASADPADRPLAQGKWATFLVKVNNDSRVTSPFEVRSLQALGNPEDAIVVPVAASGACEPEEHGWSQWFRLALVGAPSMPATLSGTEVEYFVTQICSLDAGDRAAEFTFYLGGGQVSQGHYGTLTLLFRPAAAAE